MFYYILFINYTLQYYIIYTNKPNNNNIEYSQVKKNQ